MNPWRLGRVLSAALLCAAAACGGGHSGDGSPGGSDAGSAAGDDGGIVTLADGGFALRSAPAVDQGSIPNDSLLLTAAGEVLATGGYNFPAVNDGDVVFADGWQVTFTHFIVTFDKVSLWQNPDMSPDQSQVGTLVAELDGPWAVDLHATGSGWPYIAGKEQGETAVAFAVLRDQNKLPGAPGFPTDGTRLAVGFSAVIATPRALNVNLDEGGVGAYQEMVQNGCTVLYTGQAVWRGNVAPGVCVDPGSEPDGGLPAGVGGEAEFSRIPKVVNFDLCYKPAAGASLGPGDVETSWINCDNQDNDPAMSLDGEPHQRGVAFAANGFTTGEVTFHTDHPFWESTQHDTPLRFDPFAAQVVAAAADGGANDASANDASANDASANDASANDASANDASANDASANDADAASQVGGAGIPTVHLFDMIGVDYTGFQDAQGNLLPWRTCDPNYQNPTRDSRVGPMSFDPRSVPHCTGGDHGNGLCDDYDFSKYDQSTQGHWNGSDGICFVARHYPSPR